MASVFQISKDLLDVFAELEENGGELTEELEAKLNVSQTDFKFKIKSYTDVIKYTDGEIDMIDKEIARLKELKESKEKAIARLEKVIIWATNMFGEENKNGNKFIDFGTGKVSVRNTKKVEVNSDYTDAIVQNIFSYLNMLNYTKELQYEDSVSPELCIEALKQMENPLAVTADELNNIKASFNFDVNLKDLLNGQGLEFTKRLLSFINTYKVKSNVSKSDLKTTIEEGKVDVSNIGHIVENQTVTIK